MKQFLISLDQTLNTLLGGMADETLSARAHRMRAKGHRYWGWTAAFSDGLFFFDKEHCFNSHLSEKQRKHFPAEYRKRQ